MDIKSKIITVCLFLFLPTAGIADMTYQWHAFHDEVPGTVSEVVVDSDGNIYMVGSKAQFTGAGGAPTTGAIEGTLPLHPYSGEEEMVVVKFDSAGDYQWHTYYGSDVSLASETYAFGIALDSQNNVYIAGVSSDAWLGDGDTNPLHDMGFAESVYVLKLNSAGEYQWHTFYGEYVGQTADIVVDSEDDVYVVGVDRSPPWNDVGIALHGSSGGDDLFVVKLDGDGGYQWHTFYGPATASGNASSSGNGVNSLAIDGDDNIFVAGSGESSWFGDLAQPPLNPFDDSSAPLLRQDIYVLKLDSE